MESGSKPKEPSGQGIGDPIFDNVFSASPWKFVWAGDCMERARGVMDSVFWAVIGPVRNTELLPQVVGNVQH